MNAVSELVDFWYAVELSSMLGISPVGVQLLGKRYVLYRDKQGNAHAMVDRCPHRGASLVKGWVEDNCIRCPYHGWAYNSDGRCTKIPADPSGTPIPARARLRVLPTRERSGFIWIFPGEPDLADGQMIPELPELNQAGWRSVEGEACWNNHFSRVVEAGLEFADPTSRHPQGHRYKPTSSVDASNIETGKNYIKADARIQAHSRERRTNAFARRSQDHAIATVTCFPPSVNKVAIVFNDNDRQQIYFASHIPVSETETLTKWIVTRNFSSNRWGDKRVIRQTCEQVELDKAVVEAQPLTRTWETAERDCLVAADQLVMAYRKRMQKTADSHGH